MQEAEPHKQGPGMQERSILQPDQDPRPPGLVLEQFLALILNEVSRRLSVPLLGFPERKELLLFLSFTVLEVLLLVGDLGPPGAF